MVYKFFDKRSALCNKYKGSDNKPNYQLANELHKPIIKKFKKRKGYSFFRDNIWGVDLADMQSLSKYNKGIKYLLCAIDLFGKYAWVIPLKDKKGVSIVNAFKKIISKGRKPNKIWVNQGSEFYNNSFKHMTAISKNVYFDVLDDIVNKYNNTVHRTIKIKPTDVTDDSYVDYNEDFNKKDPKFKVGDHVRISKYKNIFAKGFVVNKIKNTVPWTYVINDLNGEKISGSFYEKELQKTNQKEFRIKKVLKRRGDKLYVKWKQYDNRFNSWIDEKDLIRV